MLQPLVEFGDRRLAAAARLSPSSRTAWTISATICSMRSSCCSSSSAMAYPSSAARPHKTAGRHGAVATGFRILDANTPAPRWEQTGSAFAHRHDRFSPLVCSRSNEGLPHVDPSQASSQAPQASAQAGSGARPEAETSAAPEGGSTAGSQGEGRAGGHPTSSRRSARRHRHARHGTGEHAFDRLSKSDAGPESETSAAPEGGSTAGSQGKG